ncbi:DUF6801 domain-containing protein [Amycolatopsis minnesotensis]|uniref:DUF6801 domain-containing protein n=1 Tax=Amycolatopsis minnesotensis TaxID=337894 RepID=UPI0031D71D28
MTRRRTRLLALASAVAVAGVSFVANPAVAGAASAVLPATCPLPGGPSAVTTGLTATFPETTGPGRAIEVGGAGAELVFPEQTVAALKAWGVTTFEGAVDGSLIVRQGSAAEEIALPAVKIPLTKLPAAGELWLPLGAAVPEAKATGGGDVTFEVAKLAPTLKLHAVKDNALVEKDVSCTSEPGPPRKLATVGMLAEDRAPGRVEPGTPRQPSARVALADDPPYNFPPTEPTGWLRYALWIDDSTTTIKKLGSQVKFGRGQFDSVVQIATSKVRGNFRLPPTSSYFVPFRITPATADVEVVQAEEAAGAIQVKFPTSPVDITIKADVVVRNAKVDGVPLDVGPNCRTATPVTIHLKQEIDLRPPKSGGKPTPVSTAYDIPPFAGCQGTEDVSKLLTGLISGPDNPLTMTLNVRCTPADCPPPPKN